MRNQMTTQLPNPPETRPSWAPVKERLSTEDFDRLGELITSTWGIKMPQAKKEMLEGRLTKRLRALGLSKLSDYCAYLFSPEGQQNEILHVIDVVSTNKTDFFREPESFNIMVDMVLPQLVKQGVGRESPFMIWSAGCATGEEPYTMAMFLEAFAEKNIGRPFSYLVLATDISVSALDIARRGVYKAERIAPVPLDYRHKYLLRGKRERKKEVRVCPRLRSRVKFRQMNLMTDFGLRELMDAIFCRNVIIYFDRPTQEKLFCRFCHQLKPGGFIFIGHSETLHGMQLPLEQVAPTVYRKI